MSKMSQLHAELSESAADLGFENIQQAEEAGFVPNWNTGRLEKKDWLNEAHADILKERDEIIEDLKKLVTRSEYDRRTKTRAIEFLRTEVK